jgi:hypothetical protein
MTLPICYPLVVFYDAASPDCVAKIEPLLKLETAGRLQLQPGLAGGIRARDAQGRWLVGIVALEAAYRAAWAGSTA